MKFLLRYLELIFTAAGIVVIFGVTALIHPADTSSWAVAAITATLVSVVHGILFWVIRQRQRQTRRNALAETERMLRDIVINQLAVIRLSVDLQQSPAFKDSQRALNHVEEAIKVIDATLGDISEESIARWQTRYGKTGTNLRP